MVLKELDLTVFTLGEFSGLERTDFNSFYSGKVSHALKKLILTVSTLGRCGSPEKTEFKSFYFTRVL